MDGEKRKTFIPEERSRTVRQEILDILTGGELSASDLSKMVRKSEKEIYDHLDQLKKAGEVDIVPAVCSSCDYVFEQRAKVKKPSKCPKCKGTRIEPPHFVSVK